MNASNTDPSMISVPVIIYEELSLEERSGGKETAKKGQEDYPTFPLGV